MVALKEQLESQSVLQVLFVLLVHQGGSGPKHPEDLPDLEDRNLCRLNARRRQLGVVPPERATLPNRHDGEHRR